LSVYPKAILKLHGFCVGYDHIWERPASEPNYTFDIHASVQITLDTYSHVTPGLQEAAARSFDNILNTESELDKELKELIQS
jgi:hypothetical protein